MKYLRIKAFLLLTVLLVSLSVAAQTSEQEIRRHVGKLASDEFAGRRTGENGAKAAGEYVADQFKKVGLMPAAGKGYMQYFPFITGVEPAKDGNGFFINESGAPPSEMRTHASSDFPQMRKSKMHRLSSPASD